MTVKNIAFAAAFATFTMAGATLSGTAEAAPFGSQALPLGLETIANVEAQPVHFRGGRRHGHRGFHRRCRPFRALRKARRLGVRRARIVLAGPRGYLIKGRQFGARKTVGIGRHRSCPVVFAF